jgi:hypothetical protein
VIESEVAAVVTLSFAKVVASRKFDAILKIIAKKLMELQTNIPLDLPALSDYMIGIICFISPHFMPQSDMPS